MGARLVKFDVMPHDNEQIEALVRIPEEKRSIIHGVVKDWKGKLVKEAVVELFEVTGSGASLNMMPISHCFTDEYGHFLFGPLHRGTRYAIKVWVNDAKIRELIITPEDGPCDEIENEEKVQERPYEKLQERNRERLNDRPGEKPFERPHEKQYERQRDRANEQRRDEDFEKYTFRDDEDDEE